MSKNHAGQRAFHELRHEGLRTDLGKSRDFRNDVRLCAAGSDGEYPGRLPKAALIHYLSREEILRGRFEGNPQTVFRDDDFEMASNVKVELAEALIQAQVVIEW